jgi:hypothetical protein
MRGIRRRSAAFLAVLLAVAVGGRALAATPVIQSGLIGYWSFDDSADMGKDDSGNGLDGTLNGGPTFEAAGQFGGAIVLDGINDYVNVGPVGLGGNSPKSIAGWARSAGAPSGWANIFGLTNVLGNDANTGFDIEQRDIGNDVYAHMIGNDHIIVRNVASGVWRHYAMTFDGSTVLAYVDGVLELTLPGQSLNTYDHFNMGYISAAVAWTAYYYGAVDEVYAFDRALTTEEVEFLHDPSLLNSVSIEAIDADANEAGPDDGAFTVTRGYVTSEALTVNILVEGTATEGTDYGTFGTTVTIPSDEASATLTVTPATDGVAEESETVIVTVQDGTGYMVGTPASATVTILDSTAPTVEVEATVAQLTEGDASTDVFTITQTGGPGADVDVTISVAGTATEGAAADYILTANATPITLTAGEATLTVPVAGLVIAVVTTNDDTSEANETVTVSIVDPGDDSYFPGTESTASATIIDDDAVQVTVVATVPTAEESATAPVDGVFTVTRTGDTSAALTVNFDVSGTAAVGTDYAGIGTSATVPAGSISATMAVTPIDNVIQALERTVIVTLVLNASAYELGDPYEATVTIQEDDNYFTAFNLTSPDGTTDLEVDAVNTFTWTDATGDVSPDRYDLIISTDGVAFTDPTVVYSTTTTADVDAGTLNYEETYYWKVTANHSLATMDSDDVFSFTTLPDTKGPEVLWVSPRDGMTDVEVSSDIRITFDEDIAETSVAGSVTVTGGGVTVQGQSSLMGLRTILFTPDGELDYETTYTVTVSTAVTDVPGNNLDSAYTFSFTTFADIAGVATGDGCLPVRAGARTQTGLPGAGGGIALAVLGLAAAALRRRSGS